MGKNCLLCGVGGQGVVLASKLIAYAAMKKGLNVRTSETIGMSQRGGSVVTHVRMGETVHSPMIPKGTADVIMAFEPAEAVRNLSYLKEDGVMVVDKKAVKPVTATLSQSNYDGQEALSYLQKKVKNLYIIDGEAICEEAGVPAADIISVAAHDTQSAISATPCEYDDFAFISCGTWSLFGTEVKEPIINEKSKELNVTNEGGFGYSTAFLKNICGLWLIQESRRQWIREGKEYSYAELEKLALECEPFKCFIDPDAPEFGSMGNLPERVKEYCKKTGQYVPQTVGEIMRCIYESLALKYRLTFDGIKDCTGKSYDRIHVMGGGTKDKLLLKMTAQSCDVDVYGGPIEATALGNVAIQLISCGAVSGIKEVRKIIAEGENLTLYKPENNEAWQEAYKKFSEIIK